jgi:hypothetical protein
LKNPRSLRSQHNPPGPRKPKQARKAVRLHQRQRPRTKQPVQHLLRIRRIKLRVAAAGGKVARVVPAAIGALVVGRRAERAAEQPYKMAAARMALVKVQAVKAVRAKAAEGKALDVKAVAQPVAFVSSD